MASVLERLAGAPISWGVCEVPGWGAELDPERVLSEMAAVGLVATEAGPEGYLGKDAQAMSALLERHGLRLVGGFLPVVLHDPAELEASIAAARRIGALFEAVGASFLVSAVVVDLAWSPRTPLSSTDWRTVFTGLARLDEVAAKHGLTHVVHPHWGTLFEQREDVERLIEGSDVLLCLDTGHLVLGGTDPVTLVNAAHERIGHVHLKDVAGEVASRLRAAELPLVGAVKNGLFRALGEGNAPIAETIRALEQWHYDGWYVLEQDCALPSADVPASAGPIENVRRSVDFLSSLAGGERVASAVRGR